MTRADLLVVVLAIALLPYLYINYWGGGEGSEVHISVNGKEVASYPLPENRRITVTGSLGPSILEIRDGRVRFVDSPCTTKQCVHTGWLHSAGEVAACLPNRVSVYLSGRNPRYDSINF